MAVLSPATGRRRGFTLIELAVVIAIIGLVLGGILVPLATQVEVSRLKAARATLVDAREALYGFTIANGRLPCPDCSTSTCPGGTENDGVEDLNGAACSVGGPTAVGNLPWSTLGLDERDPWGQRYLYAVAEDFADTDDGTTNCETVPAGMSFELCAAGTLDVRDEDAGGGSPVALAVAAVAVSLGANGGAGTSGAREAENTDNDTDFVARDFTQQPGNEFDDIVTWISTNVLKSRMVSAQRLP